MEHFKYKTRGKSLPQGKPRIYFCSHPEDRDLYLDEIAEEILERQNCTIWYRDSIYEEDNEEIIATLSQMQLFVIPITLKFLTTSNRALDVEFPYAIKNHIPVLPLMQEAGLEELFNQKCGELQFLDKFNQDRTAISYSNKLGENFNAAIKEALQKSQLFALVVTPNLINETNYVQNIEYPMAKSENKHVLAAQLKDTDTKELHEKFQDLPECIDAYDSAALSEELLQTIQKIAIQENNNDPQHNFFIGLAYLGGIDMEVNTAKAFSLIEGAANSGLPQAMEKLVSMYKKAEGVERDYARAAYWQEKLADFYLNQYETTKDSKYAYEYIDTLLLLKETLDEIQSTKESEEVCQKAYIFSRKRYEEKQDDENGKHFISCCISLGDICRQERALIQAGALYQEAYRVCQNMSTEFIQYHMRCLDRLASYNEVTNHLEKALDYSLQSLSFAEKSSDRRQLAECYINFGHINMTAEKYETAKLNYEKALSIVQELCIGNPQPDTFHFLVICYRHIASACRYLDENDLSMNYLFDAIQLSDQLIDKSGYLISFQTLSDCHNDLGDIYYDYGNHTEAKKHYLKAQDIIEQLSNKVDTPKVRRAYIQNSKRINAFLQNVPDPAAAIKAGEGGVEAEELLFDLKKHIISSIVAKYSLDGIPFSELLQLGRQALIKGAKKYGRSTGSDYENYVSRALRQEITRAIAMVDREYRISVKDVEDIKKSIKVFLALKEELKRDPSLEEVSNEMNISADHLKELLIIAQKMELEKKDQEKKEEEKEKELGHLDMKYLLQHDEQAKALISEQLMNLSEREAEIMRLLYGLEGQRVHSIQETALALGLPQGRIKQIGSKVLRKLKL